MTPKRTERRPPRRKTHDELSAEDLANNFSTPDGEIIKPDDFAMRAFAASVSYSVTARIKGGALYTGQFRTYPEAMVAALYVDAKAHVAFMTAAGRRCVIPRPDFEKFLRLYNELTGQSLRMPKSVPQRRKKERVR